MAFYVSFLYIKKKYVLSEDCYHHFTTFETLKKNLILFLFLRVKMAFIT